MPKLVKINAQGRRIGDSHPRAVLSDHDIDLLWQFLDDRDSLIARMTAAGARQGEVGRALTTAGLSYRLLAAKFEIHKQTVAKIANGVRRCQTAAKTKPYP